ncbi:CsbD family protein [Xanthobacter aminoxidans]|uniref:CsbD family protein n=1 Tax=Xanthobacter aminoxidans TaxID=186280 RepID=UPI003727BCCB
MNKDRLEGAAKQAKGAVKETVGKALGDAKLKAEGKRDKVDGKIQNAVGSVKDTLKS